MSEIMLAKSFDLNKLVFPVECTIKLDGVAADFYKTPNGWVAQSRQGKALPSTEHIIKWLNKHVDVADTTHIVGELTVLGVSSFKDAAGIIRRKTPDPRIVLNVYDVYHPDRMARDYSERLKAIKYIHELGLKYPKKLDNVYSYPVKRVPSIGVLRDSNALTSAITSLDRLMECSDLFEGYVFRTLRGSTSKYNIGKRMYGMMKYKPKPTVDLPVLSFEEATANKDIEFLSEPFEAGEGLRAVGRINVLYDGEVIGCGPGCLTHEERRDLWERYVESGTQSLAGSGLIAEIEYMLDKSYDGLRQPVFKRWRLEKEEPSYEH